MRSLASLTDVETAWAEASGTCTRDEAIDAARQKIFTLFAESEEFALMCASFGS